MTTPLDAKKTASHEVENRTRMRELFRDWPITDEERLHNLPLFITRIDMGRILAMHSIYEQIVDIPGSILEFGVRWGHNLALFQAFRGILEPYNHLRRIVGFDTFEGFKGTSDKDGTNALTAEGRLAIGAGYEKFLEEVLACHEAEAPIAHIRKFEVVKGDASQTVADYLERHPETVIALAYFDMDIYRPTRDCLELIRPRLVKGSIIGFDEMAHPSFPGETMAAMEVLGLPNLRLRKTLFEPTMSYAVVDGPL